MALIKCPECGGQISDTATTCPHCGCKIRSIVNPTPLGSMTQDKGIGILQIAVAVVIVCFCSFLIFVNLFWGLVGLVIAGFVLSKGIDTYAPKFNVICPHCGKHGLMIAKHDVYKCPVCRKKSVRKDDYLNPII